MIFRISVHLDFQFEVQLSDGWSSYRRLGQLDPLKLFVDGFAGLFYQKGYLLERKEFGFDLLDVVDLSILRLGLVERTLMD